MKLSFVYTGPFCKPWTTHVPPNQYSCSYLYNVYLGDKLIGTTRGEGVRGKLIICFVDNNDIYIFNSSDINKLMGKDITIFDLISVSTLEP